MFLYVFVVVVVVGFSVLLLLLLLGVRCLLSSFQETTFSRTLNVLSPYNLLPIRITAIRLFFSFAHSTRMYTCGVPLNAVSHFHLYLIITP